MRIYIISSIALMILLIALAPVAADEGDEQKRISISTKDTMSFQDLFELLNRQYNLNIIVANGVTGGTSIHLNNVPLDEALETLTAENGLSFTRKGEIIVIHPAGYGGDPEESNRTGMPGPRIDTEVFRLNFIDAETAKTLIEPFLTPSIGQANFVKEGNLLVVSDVPPAIRQVSALIAELEKEMPQIRISVKIMLINRSDTDSQGFDWVTRFRASGAARPITFPFDRRSGGGIFRPENNPFSGDTLESSSGSEFSPNSSFPYASKDDFTFGILSAADFSLLVEFINSQTDSELKSEPEITVLHDKTAKIINGKKIKIPTYSQNLQYGITTISGYEDIQTGTNLEVTPHVLDEDSVRLKVMSEVSEITGFRGEFNEIPDVETRNVDTEVNLENGKTLIIGGLVRTIKRNTESGIPFLKDIPILGYFFRYSSEVTEKDDMIIFITPRIIDREILKKESEGIVRHEGTWVQRTSVNQASLLKTALFGGTPEQRMRGLCALARIDNEEVLTILGPEEVLVRLMEHDEETAIRTAAARILAHRYPRTYYGWLDAIALAARPGFGTDFLVEYALTEPVRHMRDITLMAAMMIDCTGSRAALIAGLGSAETCRKIRAAEAFSRFPYVGASEPLTRILDSSTDPGLRLYALYALSRCAGPQAYAALRASLVAHKGTAMEKFTLDALNFFENSEPGEFDDSSCAAWSFNESDFQVLLARLRDGAPPEISGSESFVASMTRVLEKVEQRAPRCYEMICAAVDRIEESLVWSGGREGEYVVKVCGDDAANWPIDQTASELMFFSSLLYLKIQVPTAVPEAMEAMRDQFWLAFTMANISIAPDDRLSGFFEMLLDAGEIDIPSARSTLLPHSDKTVFIFVRDET